MNIPNKRARLNRFYGDVARIQNKDIINMITGNRVLDIGCGYGTLIKQIKEEKKDIEVTGIDIDPESIKIAKNLYNIDVVQMSACKIDFPDNYFDTLILRESIHHFDTEEVLRSAMSEIKRVCRKELIVFDPNPNWIVRFARKVINHNDPEAPFNITKGILAANGFEIKKSKWRDVIAFPLSGGFVGEELVPNINFFKKAVIALDDILNLVLWKLKIQKYICWRYLIYAVKREFYKKGKED